MKRTVIGFSLLIWLSSVYGENVPDLSNTSPSQLVPGRVSISAGKPCYLRLHNTEENVWDIKRMQQGANDTDSYIERLNKARACDDGHKLGKLLTDGRFGYEREFFRYGWDRQQLRIDIDLEKPRNIGDVALHMRTDLMFPTQSAHTVYILLSNDKEFKEYAVRGPYFGAENVIGEEPLHRWAKDYHYCYRNLLYTVLLGPVDVRARYIRIITDSMNFCCDEVEVLLSRKSSREMGEPTGMKGPFFCPYYSRLNAEVLDEVTPLPLYNKTQLWNGGENWLVGPIFEVPEGVEIVESPGYTLEKEDIEIEGKPYVRYRISPPLNFIFWKTDLPEGYIGPAWLTDYKTGSPYRQRIELYSMKLPACPFAGELENSDWHPSTSLFYSWPDFLSTYWKTGMSTILLTPDKKLHDQKMTDDFRCSVIGKGYTVSWLHSSFLEQAKKAAEENKDIRRAVMPQGHRISYPCPLEILSKMDTLLLDYMKQPASLGISRYYGDWEAEYGKLGCFCPECCKRFSEFCQQKYPDLKGINAASFVKSIKDQPKEKQKLFKTAWDDFTTDIGAELWDRVRDGITKYGKANGFNIKSELGFWAVPYCQYPYIRDYKLAKKKGVLDFAMPYGYYPNPYGYEWNYGQKNWSDKTIATSGIAGPNFYGGRMVYYIALETYAYGMGGIFWFPPNRIFGRSWVDNADAVRQAALVADILNHGQIFPELLERRKWVRSRQLARPSELGQLPAFSEDAITASDGTRVVGCQHAERPGEKVVLATRYFLKNPVSFKIRVPVKQKSLVIDLYNRRQVGELAPGVNLEFPCTLTPRKHEARMFLVVPETDAWRYSKPLLGHHFPDGDKLKEPRFEWFGSAVEAEKFIVEVSRDKSFKSVERYSFDPESVRTGKDGLYATTIGKGWLSRLFGDDFSEGTYYWRVGAINTYTEKPVFTDIVNVHSKQ